MPTRASSRNANRGKKFPTSELRAVEKAIRRIVRAHDIQSRALVKASGLTAAQLVLMKGIVELGEVTSTALSAYADISPATVVTVLDNLEDRGLIERYRSGSDRRIVHTRLTETGRAAVANAPEPLGEAFARRFGAVSAEQRSDLCAALTQLADMLSGNVAAVAPTEQSEHESP